jgi:hypothetical protein
VRASRVEHSQPAIAIAEGNKILAEDAKGNRRSVRLHELLGQGRGNPMLPHELAHGRVALDAAQQVVFFNCKHWRSPNAERDRANILGF